jgi:aspartate/methionine/tyrosine aminotransferase
MAKYTEMAPEELRALQKDLQTQYDAICAQGMKLDISRGKPSPAQLKLSEGLLTVLQTSEDTISLGVDARNYGNIDGLPEAKTFFAELYGLQPEQIIIGGASSLTLMYDTMLRAMYFGVVGSEKPWKEQGPVKFIALVPGYDRHFSVCEALGLELVSVPMTETGPDMEKLEKLVAADPLIKGMWCVPKYSNPTGITYSDETVRRLAAMPTAAPDFRIFWDNAYALHCFDGETDALLNILEETKKAGNPDRVFMFGSTSKMTFPGGGVAFIAVNEANAARIKKDLFAQTIGPDKVNELRHIRFFGSPAGVVEHMQRQAPLLKIRFDTVVNTLERELSGLGIAQWSKPKGGYFVNFDAYPGTAAQIYQMAKKAGVTLTDAGAPFPYGKDPEDKNLRISPSFPEVAELQTAIDVLCLATKLAVIEKLL